MHNRLWLDLDFHRGRLTLDKSLSHDRRRRHNKSVGYNDIVALPFATANVDRKTDHANHNNWQIAIFIDPLRQQTDPSPCPLGSFPHSHLHGKQNVVNQIVCVTFRVHRFSLPAKEL